MQDNTLLDLHSVIDTRNGLTSSVCSGALNSLHQLAHANASTRDAITQLQDLLEVCREANDLVVEIRGRLAEGDAEKDELIDALAGLNRIASSVRSASGHASVAVSEHGVDNVIELAAHRR